MIETIALVIVVFALCGLIGWLDWNNRKDRSKLVNALMSKTPEQLRDLEFVEKVNPAQFKPLTPKPDPITELDLIAVDKMTEDQFAEMVGSKN